MGKHSQTKPDLGLSKSLLPEGVSQESIGAVLKGITPGLPQYVFWKDYRSVYLGCNNNFAQLLGLSSPDEIVGKRDDDLNWQPVGHTSSMFQKGDQETIMGNPITNQEEVLVLANGVSMVTLVSKLPIIDQGRVVGIVGYFADITELKQKERELLHAKKQAEIANETKSAFMINISHDIRTPLIGIIGTAKILFREIQSQQGKAAAQSLFTEANDLLELLNEVIEVTKLSFEEQPVYDVKFDLTELIKKVLESGKPLAEKKSLTLSAELDERIPSYLIGDKQRIKRILMNLLNNALKFTDHGRVQINVKLLKSKHQTVVLQIIVNDTGVGISAEDQQIIFSRFTRLEAAYKGKYRGSGLGLSVVKQFLTEIKGCIYVDSKEGEGSTFTCEIPLKRPLLDEPSDLSGLINCNADHSD